MYVVSMISFDSGTGYLPVGVHRLDLTECGRLFAWNARRWMLFGGLARAIAGLKAAGCRSYSSTAAS